MVILIYTEFSSKGVKHKDARGPQKRDPCIKDSYRKSLEAALWDCGWRKFPTYIIVTGLPLGWTYMDRNLDLIRNVDADSGNQISHRVSGRPDLPNKALSLISDAKTMAQVNNDIWTGLSSMSSLSIGLIK